MAQYADKLAVGLQALLAADENYFLNVYPSHRTMSAPQRIYDATKRVAQTVTLTEDGNGVLNATEGTPFPIPENGLQIIWNHLLRWRDSTYAP